MNRQPRPKKCRVCGETFQPRQSFATACSPKCAMALTHRAAERSKARERSQARARTRADKLALMTTGDWKKRAQAAVNAYVRARDAHLPCVSCGRWHQGQWHAGHYRTTKACPELRFEPDNIHKQCAPCNDHLSGNLIPYRVELIKRIGIERVEWIEGPHEIRRLRIEDLQEIEREFKAKLRELREAA